MTLNWKSQAKSEHELMFLQQMESCKGRNKTFRNLRVDTIRMFNKVCSEMEEYEKDGLVRMMINRWNCTPQQLGSIRHWIMYEGMSRECRYATYRSKAPSFSDKDSFKHNKCTEVGNCLCSCHKIVGSKK